MRINWNMLYVALIMGMVATMGLIGSHPFHYVTWVVASVFTAVYYYGLNEFFGKENK